MTIREEAPTLPAVSPPARLSQARTTTDATRTARLGYIPALDALRAFAVGIVILSHAGLRFAQGGKTGVLVFFVLSGYLITSVLLNEQAITSRVSFRRFYARRVLRLAPALVVVIIATSLFALTQRHTAEGHETLRAIPAVVLYVSNWRQVIVGPNSGGWFGHFWSLAVEEQFYLVWPTVLALSYRWKRLPGVAIVALVGAVASLLEKIIVAHEASGRQAGTDFAADGLLLGCALAAWVAIGVGPRARRWLSRCLWPATVAIVIATVYGRSDDSGSLHQYETFGRVYWPITVVAATVVVAVLVIGTVPSWLRRVLAWRPLVYLGRISYGMYLWHLVILGALVAWLPGQGAAIRTVELFTLTIGVASLSYRYVERPFLRRKRRLEVA
jgi:peptidoglycan/LPS O-acetylase OafA/YrhL